MQVKVLGWSKRVITESAKLLLLNMTPRRRDYFHHRAKRCNHLAFFATNQTSKRTSFNLEHKGGKTF